MKRSGLLAVLGLAIAACTTAPAPTPTGSAASSRTPSSAGVSATAESSGSDPSAGSSSSMEPTTIAPTVTTPSDPVPVVESGFLTGPGVTDTDITLGLLIDPQFDLGFGEGLALWQQTVNAAGGVCQRLVQLVGAGSPGVEAALPAAYSELAPRVLGFITLAGSQAPELAAELSLDQIPALTPSGTGADLKARSPIVIGPTTDILAVNATSYLVTNEILAAGGVLGVLTDGSAQSQDALAGIYWAAARANVMVLTAPANTTPPLAWSDLTAVFALSTPDATIAAVKALPAATVITLPTGYDPARTATVDASRILVVSPTPAFTSDHPGAVVVAKAFVDANLATPGPNLFAGYATGLAWQRLLNTSCATGALTRRSIDIAVTSVGPAPIDSLFGATDPGQQATGLPASRTAAIAQADPAVPGGLSPLSGLVAANGIAEYVPGG